MSSPPAVTSFRSHHDRFLNAYFGGGAQNEFQDGVPLGLISAASVEDLIDETFTIEPLTDTTIAIRSATGHYVTAEGGGGGILIANRAYDSPGPWETFTYEIVDDATGAVALRVNAGQYVTAELDGSVTATRVYDSPGPWEIWIASAPWWHVEHSPDRVGNRVPAGETWLDHRVCCDDNGQYLAWGPSFFWFLRAYKDYRDRYDANMAWAAAAGCTYYRGFLTVGGWPEPDGWADAAAYWSWAKDLAPVVLQDAYDRYRLRCSLTLFDGEVQFPGDAAQDQYITDACALLKPLLHTIQDVQIANEYGPCLWDYPQGVERLRRHARRVRELLGPRVTLSLSARTTLMMDAPGPEHIAECKKLFDGLLDGVLTASCNHDSREVNNVCGPWRPVRQSWERVCHDEQGNAVEPDASINDEPIGPCSSVAVEEDPSRLVDTCLTSWISGRSMYTYHTDAGIWSDLVTPTDAIRGNHQLIEDHPASDVVARTLATLVPLLPPDLPSWSRTRHGLEEHPFAASFQPVSDPTHGTVYTQIWPDGATDYGVVRFYLAYTTRDWRFVGTLMGLKDHIELTWTDPLEFDVYRCADGTKVQSVTAANGGGTLRIDQSVDTDLLVIGRWV